MARNYSNTVSGTITLAAGMDAVTTTATVSDASTLPAVDFTVLIDDEVMLVTGKAGATLTVRRGFDGTTPAVHSSGEAVRHVVVAADVGKSLVRGPVVAGEPTTAADPMDDLFDDGAIAAKWTQRNAGAAATWTEDADGLWYTVPPKAGWAVSSIVQNAPTGNFRVEAAYHIGESRIVATHQPVALLLASAAGTGSAARFFTYRTGAATPEIGVVTLNSYTSYGSEPPAFDVLHHDWGILAFERVGTEWRFEWSRTGRIWYRVATETEAWPIIEVGLALDPNNATYGMSSGFRWFRRVS